MNQGIIIISALIAVAVLIRLNRERIIKWLLALRASLKIQSLREAINGADADKKETMRKNMVVYNTAVGTYEPVQKRLLKQVERKGKNKNNAKMTEGRKRFMQQKKKHLSMPVKELEKKSLYVTN